MKNVIVHSEGTVLLVGGGHCDLPLLQPYLASCDKIVAADGGANAILAAGGLPDAVIGDFDSIRPDVLSSLPDSTVHHISEQNSTDFDKCLRNIDAPLVIGLGFLGRRLDHALAAMTVLARRPDRRCLLIGDEDVILLAPPRLSLSLPIGSRFSLFPLGEVTGRSSGLKWPIEGISFKPDGRVGTSNQVDGPVDLQFDAPKMLLILPVAARSAIQRALRDSETGSWPARAG